MKRRRVLTICLISLAVYCLVIPFRAGWAGINYSSVVGFAVYFVLTYACLKRYRACLADLAIVAAILGGRYFLDIPVVVGYLQGQTWSLPDFVMHGLGVGFAYVFSQSPRRIGVPLAIVGFSLPVLMFVWGWDYWIHRRNFGSFTGRIEAFVPPVPFVGRDKFAREFHSNDLAGRVVVLDFWHTKCGVCFAKFPVVQALYSTYENDSSVSILAVNKPLAEDGPNEAFDLIEREGYSFPVVVLNDDELPEKWGIRAYPTTLVINRQGQIVFKGDVAKARWFVNELIDDTP